MAEKKRTGRPPLFGKATTPIRVRVSPEVLETLREAGKLTRKPVSGVCRDVLERWAAAFQDARGEIERTLDEVSALGLVVGPTPKGRKR